MRIPTSSLGVLAVVVVAACSSSGVEDATPAGDEMTPLEVFSQRMDAIDTAVADWRAAPTIESAHAAAETAANLVVGPNGPGYGDRDGDGTIGGATATGLLPGLDGAPRGIATALSDNACAQRDVLGGTWSDPGARWQALADAINAWTPTNNTMPTLASHPMRVVGWATFTLRSTSLDEAYEYGGHAALHVEVARRALDC